MILVAATALVLSWLTSAGASAIVATVAKAPNKATAEAPAQQPPAIPPEGAMTR
jgi:hypothetical protein